MKTKQVGGILTIALAVIAAAYFLITLFLDALR